MSNKKEWIYDSWSIDIERLLDRRRGCGGEMRAALARTCQVPTTPIPIAETLPFPPCSTRARAFPGLRVHARRGSLGVSRLS